MVLSREHVGQPLQAGSAGQRAPPDGFPEVRETTPPVSGVRQDLSSNPDSAACQPGEISGPPLKGHVQSCLNGGEDAQPTGTGHVLWPQPSWLLPGVPIYSTGRIIAPASKELHGGARRPCLQRAELTPELLERRCEGEEASDDAGQPCFPPGPPSRPLSRGAGP